MSVTGTEARCAVVTGGGNGVGMSIATALHGGAYRVMIADIDEAAAQRLATELDPSGETAFAHRLDVREKAQFEAALAAVTARFGAVHVLVNNAAMTVARPLMEISPEEFDAVRVEAEAMGFAHVEAGPLVRSSYHARAGIDHMVGAPS